MRSLSKAALLLGALCWSGDALAQQTFGAITATPLYSTPTAYTSGTTFNALAFGAVTLTCTTAPSAGTISTSPDNNNDFIIQTVVMNNSSGITVTASITAVATYTLPGHQYVQASLTGGTCFISGGQ